MKNNEWLNFKYALCENEIQCDGKIIAYSESSLFDLPRPEFEIALKDLGVKLGWLVGRANMMPELLDACQTALNHFSDKDDPFRTARKSLIDAIKKTEEPYSGL